MCVRVLWAGERAMKMETPSHQLHEPAREGAPMDGRTGARMCVYYGFTAGGPAQKSPGRVHAQRRTNIDEKVCRHKSPRDAGTKNV